MASLRETIKSQRINLSADAQHAASHHFLDQFQTQFAPKRPVKIGAYLAIKGELDLSPTIQWLRDNGHLVFLPIIAGDRLLSFGHTTDNTIYQPNRFGIEEPITDVIMSGQDLDVVLAPLMAFDNNKNRLGMGGGFYDRTFECRKETNKPTLIGCAYDFQEVNALHPETWDIPMDEIIIASSSLR